MKPRDTSCVVCLLTLHCDPEASQQGNVEGLSGFESSTLGATGGSPNDGRFRTVAAFPSQSGGEGRPSAATYELKGTLGERFRQDEIPDSAHSDCLWVMHPPRTPQIRNWTGWLQGKDSPCFTATYATSLQARLLCESGYPERLARPRSEQKTSKMIFVLSKAHVFAENLGSTEST